jgi:hypothetical protein
LRRIGFSGGTGGGLLSSSIPFLKLAPAGREIVSITDVVEIRIGSEMSVFWMDFFRGCDRALVPWIIATGGGGIWAAVGKLGAAGTTGVDAPESGGVATPAWNGWTPGLSGMFGEKPFGDWRGDIGRLGESMAPWMGKIGDDAPEEALIGLAIGGGNSPWFSNG